MPDARRAPSGDQYRRSSSAPLIRTAVGQGGDANHANDHGHDACRQGQGFTSINLALSIAAELDHTVMLVDADVARPSVLRMLGLPSGPGLLDVLEERADMSDVLLRTNIDKT